MKALAIVDRFGIDDLKWIEMERPKPRRGEVLVEIKAAALNYRDLQIVEGGRQLALPLIPLSDAAGVVVETGEDASRFRAGDRVMPTFVQGWIAGPHPQIESLPTLGGPLDGVCRPFAAWREDSLVRAPDTLSDIEAATLPCAGVSAWNALFTATHIGPGSTVVVQGTGGVALFALQFAKLAGAEVVLISSSDAKMERVRSLGADHTVNYRSQPDWGAAVRRIIPGGVDCVVEVGGENTMAQSIQALRNGGHISYVGFLTGSAARFDLGELSRKSLSMKGIRVGNRLSFEDMCGAIVRSGLHPVVDSVFGLTALPDALRRLKQGSHFGKIALQVGDQLHAMDG